ncbi:hypothetical protein NDU88_004808 [Pleurodeles waltl]|uniref:Uncharacterized protein n=1 Tax=Pleurodeles waltl TaxID=8319 RepID=A0AAV7WAT5_PLEWA|nr:hypothetical protein NDU88_004808 [Pleurodeles waltl]
MGSVTTVKRCPFDGEKPRLNLFLKTEENRVLSAEASRALNTRVKYVRNVKRAASRGPDASPEEKNALGQKPAALRRRVEINTLYRQKSTKQNERKQ